MVVTALAGVLAVSAGLELWQILLLGVAVFAGQLSIGLSNDAIDAERDRAVGRTDKPIARGDITVRTAWTAAILCVVAALCLSAPLGLPLLGAHAVALISAWSYNLGLKATPVSVVPYMVTFGIFPSLAVLSADQPQWAAAWAWCAGAALGVALHLTNVLPDLDDDAQTGIRGLPHRLGGGPSALVASAALVAGAYAATAGPREWDIAEVSALSWVFFGLVLVVAVITVSLGRRERMGRMQFRLAMFAALVLAAQLVASGGSLAT